MNGFLTVTNQTPSIPVPSGWAYQSSPGDFFWLGFGIAFGLGVVCLVVRFINRRLAGGTYE